MRTLAKKYSFNRWAAAAPVLSALLLFAFVAAGVNLWNGYRDSVINGQKEQMLLTTISLSDSLKMLVEEYRADLEGLCSPEGMAGEAGIKIREYQRTHSLYVRDVQWKDDRGELYSVCGLRETRIYAVTPIDASTVLYQAKTEDGPECMVLRRALAGGESLSLYLDSRAYYEKMISGIRIGSSGYVVVKDSQGTVLMHPLAEQWGIDVIEDRYRLYPGVDLTSLEAMIRRQEQGETGVSEYYSYWWEQEGTPRVKKISAYAPARVGEGFLIVSTVLDYNDVYLPLARGVVSLMGFFGCALVFLSLLVLWLPRLLAEKKADREKIAYLTELNRLLEEMHQSEEAIAHQQRLQIMGTMTGGIAHEFNNLLTPIMGYADLLLMELPEDSDSYDSANEIYQASAKAKEMIQQISSLSRKNMETAYKSLNGARVLRRALKMVQSACPANVRLEQEISLTDECFLGNETQFNQVILNICVNAIHAIGRSEGLLRVTARAVGRQALIQAGLDAVPATWERYLAIDIADDGCGMTPEVLKQIFDPFFTTKTGGEGTGLGLALVEQIVGSHKGYLRAESSPGAGSVFHLWLPVSETADERERSAPPEGQAAEFKLLVVDDNAKVIRLLEKSFGRLGVTAAGAMQFEEARERLKKEPFDAVAAEQYIEGGSAVDFFMSIRGLYPSLVRLVMAEQVTRELAEARQRGIIDAYISKPVSDAAILKAVREARKERK